MLMLANVFIFFFSSRRRHTRWPRDWSSDVCSSDLCDAQATRGIFRGLLERRRVHGPRPESAGGARSEERRVGKECRTWRATDLLKKEMVEQCEHEDCRRMDSLAFKNLTSISIKRKL